MAGTLAAMAAKSIAGPGSRVERAVDQLPDLPTNVSGIERWLSFAAGGALIGVGTCGSQIRLLPLLAGSYLVGRAATGYCPVSNALNFSTSESTSPATAVTAGHGTRVDGSITIQKPALEAYRLWRDFELLPTIFDHLIDVDTTTDGRSHWVAKGPLGLRVEWDAEILVDIPGEVIGWKSLPGSDVDAAGSVHFVRLPGNQTQVRVHMKYDPPLGRAGRAVALLFGDAPEQQLHEDLERFKRLVEGRPVERVGSSS